MKPVRVTVRARADLERIATYTQERRGRAARMSYLDRIERALDKLAANPALGRQREELPGRARSFPVGQHLVIYRVEPEEHILVIRVLHQSMDYPEHVQERALPATRVIDL